MAERPGARSCQLFVQPWRGRWSRRRFLSLLGGAMATAGAGYSYMRWVEPSWLAVRIHHVPLAGAKPSGSPIRLLHLSDFHASPEVDLRLIDAAVQEGLRLKPDLICVTGDFITWRYEAFPRYAEILKPLADAAPAVAVLGNHDGGRWVGTAGYPNTDRVRALASAARLQLLHNQAATVQAGGRVVRLVGVGDLWADEMDGPKAFAPGAARSAEEAAAPVVLLAHNPDSKDALRAHRWDLMLS